VQSRCAKYSYRVGAGHVLTTQRALEKVIYGTSWTSVSVLTGGQVLGFHTSGKHLANWSTIYYNASIDLCIQLNTIGLLQPLSLASRFMPILSNCKALVSCTYHKTLTLWYNLTFLGICQATSVSQKRDAQEDRTMM
jgi:hypothetical protein